MNEQAVRMWAIGEGRGRGEVTVVQEQRQVSRDKLRKWEVE